MDDQISSTTGDQQYLQQQRAGNTLIHDDFTEEMQEFSDCKNLDLDDILDLAGGAKDAIERHRSEDQITDRRNLNIIKSQAEKEEAHAEAKAPSSQCKYRPLPSVSPNHLLS